MVRNRACQPRPRSFDGFRLVSTRLDSNLRLIAEMGRSIVVLGGNSHPQLVASICHILGISPCDRILTKFSVGETRCEIQDSVRGKDVYIIQTGSGKVNDELVDLLIMISALKTGKLGNLRVDVVKIAKVLKVLPSELRQSSRSSRILANPTSPTPSPAPHCRRAPHKTPRRNTPLRAYP